MYDHKSRWYTKHTLGIADLRHTIKNPASYGRETRHMSTHMEIYNIQVQLLISSLSLSPTQTNTDKQEPAQDVQLISCIVELHWFHFWALC